jgi:phosphomannomutase
VEKRPFLLEYAAQLRELIKRGAGGGEKPLEGMKVIVDAGNGSGVGLEPLFSRDVILQSKHTLN